MDERLLTMGRVVGLFGVDGWIKVESFAEPRLNLARYRPWRIVVGERERIEPKPALKAHGKGLIAKLEGVDDRDGAAALIGAEIRVARSALPKLKRGERYWADLEGARVMTIGGVDLGVISHLFSTAANDVVVVTGDRERLLPWIDGVIIDVAEDARTLTVDWDPGF